MPDVWESPREASRSQVAAGPAVCRETSVQDWRLGVSHGRRGRGPSRFSRRRPMPRAARGNGWCRPMRWTRWRSPMRCSAEIQAAYESERGAEAEQRQAGCRGVAGTVPAGHSRGRAAEGGKEGRRQVSLGRKHPQNAHQVEAVRRAVFDWNAQHCSPPWEENALATLFDPVPSPGSGKPTWTG